MTQSGPLLFTRDNNAPFNERRVNNMFITIFVIVVSIGFFIGYGVKRHQINKMTKQMLQLEEQKRLLQTRHIVDL